jgi:hypothetical protein
MQVWMQHKGLRAHIGEQMAFKLSVDCAIMNAVSQWWIGGLRTRKAKVMSSILMGGSPALL